MQLRANFSKSPNRRSLTATQRFLVDLFIGLALGKPLSAAFWYLGEIRIALWK